MQWGKEGRLDALEGLARTGVRVPALERRPDIGGLEWLWNAFVDLSSCRQYSGFGLGPIPWTAIQKYAEVHELDAWDREQVFSAVQAMDKAYLNYIAENPPKPSKPVS